MVPRGEDVILGSEMRDVIDGNGGNDSICALVGNDDITGTPGIVELFGGAGNDVIGIFGSFSAVLTGGDPDDDTRDGGEGGDQILGQNGDTAANCETVAGVP